MDLLHGYSSASSENEDNPKTIALSAAARNADRQYLNAAPKQSLLVGRTTGGSQAPQARSLAQQPSSQTSLVLMNNPTKLTMYQPVQGPSQGGPQHSSSSLALAGAAEADVSFDETTFQDQRTTFQRTGQASAPDGHGSVITRSTLGYDHQRLEKFSQQDERRTEAERALRKRRREEPDSLVHGSDDEIVHGIWAPPSLEERMANENQLSDIAKGGIESLAPEQLAEREHIKEKNRRMGQEEEAENQQFDRLVERKMSHLLPPQLGSEEPKACEATTQFHGSDDFDYRGRSWTAPPAGLGSVLSSPDALDVDHHRCFVPKKCVHRFTGHNKGVQRIRLFPRTGHLMLSAGLDGKCKVWSVEEKQVMRTYIGHTAAVRDVQFNHDGSKFVSASFDRFLRMWDTETGKVLGTFTNRRVPYVVQFYPHDDNFFVVGCSDNKIVTYDATSGEITQEYNHHLAPVNAIVFVEDHGTKMISSSDDKKVLVWEWEIGVPTKYISDPTMHSMPCMTLHPTGQYFVGQSLDNTIMVYQGRDRFALQRKKKFSGHQVSGYACDICFSPDGQFLVSGDGNGKVFFWEWKRSKLLQKYRAHDKGPAIGCVWHPLEPSTVFTCGWDGVIKMWK